MALELRPALGEAVTVVPDGRAAQQWEAYLSGARADRPAVWLTPSIVPYRAWCERLWTDLDETAREPIASRAQALALWRATIGSSSDGADLLGVDGAASWASAAAALVREWLIDPGELRAGVEQPDFYAFLRWFREYRERLAAHGWIDHAELAARLAASDPPAPARLVLADLGEPTPAQTALVARLERAGCAIERLPQHEGTAALARRTVLPDSTAELTAAAAWAATRLAHDPGGRIALVVPDLASRTAELERAFAEHAGAGVLWHRASRAIDEPPTGAALGAVELVTPGATFTTLSHWLRSPFFASDPTERAARALLERDLRGMIAAQLPFAEAYRAGFREPFRRTAPRAATALERALAEIADVGRTTPTRWTAIWQRLLAALGWLPGAAPVDDPASSTWRSALDELATLTPVLGEIDARSAFTELERALGDLRAAPPMPLAGVHAFERVEEIGPGYDAAWITGFTDAYWPQAARANPLLPRALQRAHAMPWSSPQDARDRSARTLAALMARTRELVFSTPARIYDFAAEPSPAIRALPVAAAHELAPSRRTARLAAARETLEDRPPPLPGDVLVGSTGALNLQARCPLRAFCEHRLAAKPLETVAAGIPPRLRGVAAHRALALVYGGIESSAALADLGDDAIVRCVEQALAETFRGARHSLGAVYALERERLATLVGELVRIDRARAPFRIAAVEERRVVELGRWSLRIRLDRLDTLDDGSIAVIDYKTGEASTNDWFRERLRDVQVPLYAVHAAANVSAAVLARVRAPGAGYVGIWQNDGAFPGRSRPLAARDWHDRLALWRRELEALAAEYGAGDVRVFDGDLDEARGVYAPLTRILEQSALTRGALARW